MSVTYVVCKSLPGCHGYHSCCSVFELPAEAEETVESQGWSPWLSGVSCVKCMVRQEKHSSVKHLVHHGSTVIKMFNV